MSRSLRVLLISPVRGLDPPNGDVTYTEQLLECPPEGVEYVTYPQALASGALRELYRRQPGQGAVSALQATGRAGLLREALINQARRRGVLFREPFRHFELRTGEFDLIHCHVFSIGLRGARPPLVISNSAPVHWLYRDGLAQGPRTTALRARLDALIAARTGVTHAAYGQRDAALVICFSDHLAAWFRRRGGNADRFVVIPPAISADAPRAVPTAETMHIGFIGDWQVKGGPTLLEAMRILRRDGAPVTLTIVGAEPVISEAESRTLGVEWLPRQPRSRLRDSIIPSFSVFAYPSRFDGLPLTLLEVMAAAVPVVVSDYGALPEVVDHGRAGLVVARNRPADLATRLRELLDPAVRTKLGRAGRARVEARFSPATVSAQLRRAYDLALTRAGSAASW